MFKFAQVIDQRARGFGLGVQPHGKDFFHQRAGEHNIRIAASHVHKMGAQGREQKVEKVDDEDAYGQNPEGFHGVVGHHPVIDVHDKQGAAHGNEVDDHAGQGHMAVNGRVIAQHVPKPALAVRDAQAVGPVVGRGLYGGEQGVAGILFAQGLQGHHLAGFARFGKDDLGHLAVQGRKHAGAVVGEQEDAGQNQAGDVFQLRAVGDAA